MSSYEKVEHISSSSSSGPLYPYTPEKGLTLMIPIYPPLESETSGKSPFGAQTSPARNTGYSPK